MEEIAPNWAESEEAKRQVPEFISALRDSDWVVRKAAAEALGEIKDKRALWALISVLIIDSDKYVRRAAALALGELKDERAVEPLSLALNDEYKKVRIAARKAIEKIRKASRKN